MDSINFNPCVKPEANIIPLLDMSTLVFTFVVLCII